MPCFVLQLVASSINHLVRYLAGLWKRAFLVKTVGWYELYNTVDWRAKQWAEHVERKCAVGWWFSVGLTKSDPFAHPLFTSIIYRCSFNAFFNAVWVEHIFSSVGHAYVYNICHFEGSWHGKRCTRELSCRGHFDVEWVPYVFLISFRVMKSHLILS